MPAPAWTTPRTAHTATTCHGIADCFGALSAVNNAAERRRSSSTSRRCKAPQTIRQRILVRNRRYGVAGPRPRRGRRPRASPKFPSGEDPLQPRSSNWWPRRIRPRRQAVRCCRRCSREARQMSCSASPEVLFTVAPHTLPSGDTCSAQACPCWSWRTTSGSPVTAPVSGRQPNGDGLLGVHEVHQHGAVECRAARRHRGGRATSTPSTPWNPW